MYILFAFYVKNKPDDMIEWPSVYGVFLFSVQDAVLGSSFSIILLDRRFGD